MESAQTTGKSTVREYAEAHNISHQAIYRKIKRGQLKTEKEKINGKEVVFILSDGEHNGVVSDATPVQPVQRDVQHLQPDVQQGMQHGCNQKEVAEVADLCNHATTFATDVQPDMQPVQPPETAGDKDIIAFLQKQIEEQNRQLSRKDEQIASLTQLLDQEQKLHARTNLLLAEYQSREAEQKQTGDPEDGDQASPETKTDPEPEQTPEPQSKFRQWLHRIFG